MKKPDLIVCEKICEKFCNKQQNTQTEYLVPGDGSLVKDAIKVGTDAVKAGYCFVAGCSN
ncbi:unnamed protein product [Eruca vesicaria subsp. sativa]|uniref:Uncharacterized protein n=1 Tax=Eruca vesicaria subsp. sativa TaxID=29727 RepID=A0ABC8K275_ERUVS|nr:unnamed protein product [Eruca vesicaria subsp. sativa]